MVVPPNEKKYFKMLEYPIGWIGIYGTSKGLTRLQLPECNKKATEEKLLSFSSSPPLKTKTGPKWMLRLEKKLHRFFSPQFVEMGEIPLDINISKFQQAVYTELKKISYGKSLTYKDLAIRIHSPQAARAVGNALGKNPVPLVIPCHRVISSSQSSLGGFSAFGGVKLKQKLLNFENKN